MSFIYFIRLVFKNLLWLVLIPSILAGSIFYFTRWEKKVYSSESVIYTGIASGYSLSGSTKADYFATSNAFDNLLSLINSRETRQDVALGLLARHLQIKKHDPALLSWGAYDELEKLVPDGIRQKLVKPTLEETIISLHQHMTGGDTNLIYKLVNSDNPYYSLDALSNIKSERINNSDLIKISYHTNDAVICKQTLELLEACFIEKHRSLKEGQSESVVNYFETKTVEASVKLNDAEQRFMEFNKKNDIINYYEQTKAVAGERENLYALDHTLEMDKMASSKSLEKVNENIKGRLYQNEYGAAILKEREQLSDLYSRIAVGEIVGAKDASHRQEIDSMRNVATVLDKKLQGSVNNLYNQTNTPNGIPTKGVLDEWLKTTLQFEQSKARLTVMDKRKAEFQQEYRKFAPLGAILKQIERQINVSEQEYLELLHGLNTAKLTQQNNELTTKMNIVDPPYLPVKANPSKRKLLIVVGFMVGFVLVLAFILAKALINQTMQHPERARKLVGIPLLGIYPLMNSKPEFIDKANLRLMQQLLSRIDMSLQPVTIGLLSIQSKEGKSTMIDLFYNELTKLNYQVEKQGWNSSNTSFTTAGEIILMEFPPLDSLVVKPGLLPPLNHTFLVCRANRVWTRIDKELLTLFSKTTGNQPSLILNGVDTVFAEEYIGDVPKRRFYLRSLLKGVVKFEFGNKKKIG